LPKTETRTETLVITQSPPSVQAFEV
jgi:hypothetical protein